MYVSDDGDVGSVGSLTSYTEDDSVNQKRKSEGTGDGTPFKKRKRKGITHDD